MDIDNFAQCISYMRGVVETKSLWEKALPYGGGVLGVLIGFYANAIKEKLKEGRDTANKMMCIKEDVHRARNSFELAVIEGMKALGRLKRDQTLKEHNMPSDFSLPMLDEYFYEIAHKYSSDERYWLKELISYSDSLNGGVDKLLNAKGESKIQMVKYLMTVVDCASWCINVSSLFLKDEARKETVSLLAYLADKYSDKKNYCDYEVYKHWENALTAPPEV
ncbi:hypothetical protein ISX54_05195 [Pseudomonas aeruginosa]|uniref:hypothetical protein n=1 Tax=Pseudomonas aeruginosa TaxID=287 RepID=UPI0018881AE0|nr:hypothetical protein [Pseudomonas aeruginosa]MBF1838961.1 hypothetical protein [Pseudomonas aeruginosa]HBO4455640.1 hypothetical protein [Pseudomonas aeruginosa]